mgnify:CR=1 FL=1
MKHSARNFRHVMAHGESLDNLILPGSGMKALSSNGEINAHDRNELMQNIGKLMAMASAGQIVEAPQEDAMTSEEFRDLIAQANSNLADWAALGAAISDRIVEQADRAGFMRNLAVGNNLKQGEYPRIPMFRHEVQAVVSTSPTQMGYQLIRDRQFTPAEYEVKSAVRVSQLELDQSSGDLLRDIRDQAMEAVMVAEDRIWKRAVDATVGRVNDISYISGELTPKMLASLSEQVSGWNLPATKAIISNDFWKDIIGNSEFSSFLDPVSKYDLVMNGKIGTLIGMELMTDGFRPENQRVLDKGEIYVVSDPEHHAAFSTRGIRSTPTDGANQGETNKGWLISQSISFLVGNVRSVAKGKRI